VQRILQRGEIEALDRIEFPRVRLPQPPALFSERAARLRQLAPGNPIGDYLRFVARLVDVQARAAVNIRAAVPDEPTIARALEHGMPVLPASESVDPAWRQALRLLLAAIRDDGSSPPASLQVAAMLGALGDDSLDALAVDAISGGVAPQWQPAQPVVMAALQVAFTDAASRLDTTRIAYVDPATICPVCGSLPVASVLRIGGQAGGHRYLHCALCATEWHLVRVKCSHCESTKGVRYQGIEGGERTVLAETCDECHTYRKQADQEKDPFAEPMADDLASLMLDLLMAETPFARASENPWLSLAAPQDEPEAGT
jgi:FdhE protein